MNCSCILSQNSSPPYIKHNRIPAPEMSFTQPNLPALIREIETIIKKVENEAKSKQD